MRRAGEISRLGFKPGADCLGAGDDFQRGVSRSHSLFGALVFDAGRTASRADVRPTADAAVEKVGVKFYG